MEIVIPVLAAAALLWLIARGTPRNRLLVVVAVTLAVVVAIVAIERGGFWPAGLTTR